MTEEKLSVKRKTHESESYETNLNLARKKTKRIELKQEFFGLIDNIKKRATLLGESDCVVINSELLGIHRLFSKYDRICIIDPIEEIKQKTELEERINTKMSDLERKLKEYAKELKLNVETPEEKKMRRELGYDKWSEAKKVKDVYEKYTKGEIGFSEFRRQSAHSPMDRLALSYANGEMGYFEFAKQKRELESKNK